MSLTRLTYLDKKLLNKLLLERYRELFREDHLENNIPPLKRVTWRDKRSIKDKRNYIDYIVYEYNFMLENFDFA